MASTSRSLDLRLVATLLLGGALFGAMGPAASAPCRGSGELDPPLRADEFWHEQFSPASGYERTALFQVPQSAPAEDRALVVLLHGGGGSNREDILSDMRFTGWVEIAERDGIVLAYPTAMQDPSDSSARLNWNDGRLGTDAWSMPDHANIDDLGYLAEIIDFAQNQLSVGERVYVLGISNGGMMALRLATDSRTQGRIGAMTTLVAQIPEDRFDQEVSAVPLLMIQGEIDPLIPSSGGEIWIQPELNDGRPIGEPVYSSRVVSFEDTLARFIAAHGCRAQPRVRNLPDKDGDGIYVREITFCPMKQAVQAYLVVGGGHRWHGIGDNSKDWTRECNTLDTGSATFNYYVQVGPSTLDGFSATRAAWRFFQGH